MENESGNVESVMVTTTKTVQREDEPATTMVVASEVSFRRQMEPNDFGGLYTVAIELAKVHLCGVSTPQEALVRMLTGRELGLTMMQAMRGVYVVEGTPSLSAALKQSICLSRPDVCEEFRLVSSDHTHATYRVKRKGQPAQDFTWTIEDAKRALLVDRGTDPKQNNWNKYPRRMLQARAKSEAADVVFGDLLHGFATREEMEDVRDARPQAIGQHPEVVGEVVQQAAAQRDYDAEAKQLIAMIFAAKTKEERANVRKMIVGWDGVSPYKEQVTKAYNESGKKNEAAQQTAAAPAAVPATPPSVPASEPKRQREPGEEG